MGTYYHAANTDTRTPVGRMFCNNIGLSNGYMTSESFIRLAGTRMRDNGSKSPYELFGGNKQKEAVFEHVRAHDYSFRPPRLGALFLFDNRETADRCNEKWWQGKSTILEAEIVEGNFARFDAKYLDCSRVDWMRYATLYWIGEQTKDPIIEVVVQGTIRLQGYEPYYKKFT